MISNVDDLKIHKEVFLIRGGWRPSFLENRKGTNFTILGAKKNTW
jgi:hypothetical protein